MYGWIWRMLPFGWPGRLIGSAVLLAGAAALLWYLVFPAVDPYLPYNDGQVTTQTGTTNQDNAVHPSAPAQTATGGAVSTSPSPSR